jgi:hypothetical protein
MRGTLLRALALPLAASLLACGSDASTPTPTDDAGTAATSSPDPWASVDGVEDCATATDPDAAPLASGSQDFLDTGLVLPGANARPILGQGYRGGVALPEVWYTAAGADLSASEGPTQFFNTNASLRKDALAGSALATTEQFQPNRILPYVPGGTFGAYASFAKLDAAREFGRRWLTYRYGPYVRFFATTTLATPARGTAQADDGYIQSVSAAAAIDAFTAVHFAKNPRCHVRNLKRILGLDKTSTSGIDVLELSLFEVFNSRVATAYVDRFSADLVARSGAYHTFPTPAGVNLLPTLSSFTKEAYLTEQNRMTTVLSGDYFAEKAFDAATLTATVQPSRGWALYAVRVASTPTQ